MHCDASVGGHSCCQWTVIMTRRGYCSPSRTSTRHHIPIPRLLDTKEKYCSTLLVDVTVVKARRDSGLQMRRVIATQH